MMLPIIILIVLAIGLICRAIHKIRLKEKELREAFKDSGPTGPASATGYASPTGPKKED